MTTTNNWIKMSERKPTGSDLPLILGNYTHAGRWAQLYCGETLVDLDIWTHWYPQQKYPPPPPKEQTQRERDDSAYREWWYSGKHVVLDNVYIWSAALAWERAEIAKLLDGVPVEDSCSEGYSKLRDRLRP